MNMGRFLYASQISAPRVGRKKPLSRASIVAAASDRRPNPTKQNQVKLLGFALFYSSDSGLSNGLRAKKIKNFPPPFCSPRVSENAPLAFLRATRKSLTQTSD
jgi:hypothetical protein